ncbi:unnamed protein product [Trichobilharzia regenti]|nr:unnamed protein product [Trichobilharzia regenti]
MQNKKVVASESSSYSTTLQDITTQSKHIKDALEIHDEWPGSSAAVVWGPPDGENKWWLETAGGMDQNGPQ